MSRFLAECLNTFDSDPELYQDDHARVAFAASYLTGTAAQWWQGVTLEQPPNPARFNWDLFVQDLNRYCGDPNIQQTAMMRIHNLRMLPHHRIHQHVIKFKQWMGYTGYNTVSLASEFYRGLPDRIKEAFLYIERPVELEPLIQVVYRIDSQYWERQNEKGIRNRTGNNPGSASSTDTKPNSYPAEGGNIDAKERQRRMDEKLCLWCGKSGHIRPNCPTAPPPKPRTTATNITGPANNNTQPRRTGRVAFTLSEPDAEEPFPSADLIELDDTAEYGDPDGTGND